MASSQDLRPPVARKVPKETTIHGDRIVDSYFWIREKSNPGVIEYIQAENDYTIRMTEHTVGLQKTLFNEFRRRIVEEDSTVPVKVDDYFYYSRTEKGKQFPILCRKRVSMESVEEVMLDVNKLAEGNEFFNLDVHKVSPDHKFIAYLADTTGSERHRLYIKDLLTGRLLPETMQDTASVVWSNDSRTLFYSVMDHEFRPFKVFRHVLGTDPKEDVEVFHESDRRYYYLRLVKTKSKAYIMITVESASTSEVHYTSADRPSEPFNVFRPRKHEVAYFVLHHGDRFFIVTNEGAENFKIMETPEKDPSEGNWREFVPHSKTACIDVSDPEPFIEVFRDYMAIFEHENCLARIRVIDLKGKTSHIIQLPEELCTLTPNENPDHDSNVLRFEYSSMTTPETIYDYDMKARKLELRKRTEVPDYDHAKYVAERVFAKARDGVSVPMTIVHKKGMKRDGKNPCHLYAYGAYGDFEGPSPKFNRYWISLLDRGFVCASAHIRGGGDMGRGWHKQGKVLTKKNSFEDFIACAEHLIKEGYTSSDRLSARGRSAGGLLMGAVVTMRPDLFKAIVAEVPFVDVINTMLDETIPLTSGELEEWGDPRIKEHYDYMKTYSPYDNIKATRYPNMLVTSGWNDSRVQYWEPTKFVAKLRAMKTDDNVLLLRTNIVQGHSGAPGRYDALRYYSFMYAFILDKLGIKE